MNLILSILLSLSAYGELGFYESLPNKPNVEAQKSKVYRGYFPTLPLGKLAKEELVKINLDNIKVEPNASEADAASTYLIKRQLEACLKKPNEDCFVFSGSVRGSLFFIEDESTLYTAFHNVEGWVFPLTNIEVKSQGVGAMAYHELAIESQMIGDVTEVDPFNVPTFVEIYKILREKSQSVVFYDNEGQIVFGNQPGDIGLNVDFKPELLYNIFGLDMLKAGRDFVRIKISRAVGKTLVVNENHKISEAAYPLGYPISKDRSQESKPSSQGDRLYITQGKILSSEEIQERSGITFNGDESEVKQSEAAVAFCDCDGAPGNSGGVAVNEMGQATYMTSMFLPNDGSPGTVDNVLLFGVKITYIQKYFSDLEQKLK